MDMDVSQTWPPPFSSRPHASPSPHGRRRRHSKKHKPPPAPSRACRAWRDALRLLREAAALHAYGRRVKHGLVAGSAASRGAGGERLETERQRALGLFRRTERQRALGLFRRAARLDSAAAMVDAGLMCWEDGRREEAVGYYRSAADLGHPVGMCNLGVSYLEGEMVFASCRGRECTSHV
ncbi:F-box protein At1g70590-like isoform X2 [Miscanthus floridulus]|uniref:F-box protein At1g70590-like isoform X2 n=1 Tax=Miscanthus floridulus TaxID=154761 RepID=UPI003458D341